MAAKKSYPMIPATVWWKLREQFQKTIPGTVTRTYLATVLGVNERTAGNLLGPLRTVGLIDKEGKPTERANHWRFDDDYASVCKEILEEVYPEELRHAVPDPKVNREGALRWFMKTAGVGEVGANKMVATYQLLVDATPKKIDSAGAAKSRRGGRPRKSVVQAEAAPVGAMASAEPQVISGQTSSDMIDNPDRLEGIPKVHIDINVHISSDASTEQIDQIFASMARHLYKK